MTAAPAAPASDAALQSAKPRGGGLNIVLVLLLLLQLAGIGALVAWPWVRQSSAAPTAAGPTGSTAAVPDAVPALPAMTLAETAPQAAADGGSAAGRIPALIGSLGDRLDGLPLEGGAPAHLVVLGSGQQTVEKIAEIPRHERWELQFPPGNSVESYARQLEYFHIELGLIGGSDQITYVTNLADPTPKTHTAPAAEESRLYLVWQRGSMQGADEQLVSKAKQPIADRIVAHFCPPDLESQLAQLEDAKAQADKRTRVKKTVFGVRANDFGGFRLHVLEQTGD